MKEKKGYVRVHHDYDIDIDESLIRNGDYTVESGYKALVDLWEMDNPPSSILVTNYEMTIGAIMAVNDLNISIPHELSLIGFDNIQMAKVVRPPLSIVEQPMKEIGETAARLMLKRLNNDYSDFPAVYRLKTKVHIKESVSTNI